MDRIISDEERIRKAEDILERRKNTDLRISSNSFVKEKSNLKVRKMLIQILICLIIYCGIYYIKNSKNEKFNGFIGNINNALEHDVDFKSVYNKVCAIYNSISVQKNKSNEPIDNNSNKELNNTTSEGAVTDNSVNNVSIENVDNSESVSIQNQNDVSSTNDNNISQTDTNITPMGIGGESDSGDDNTLIDNSQMSKDAGYILSKMELINPLEQGIVTSKYGHRNSTSIVSQNHKGIDLGANTGSTIVSASDGKVIEASSQGDFGIHLKIQIDDIIFIYGHCNKLLVKAGDTVSRGQTIAEVGATGKATGPHLHFEVRRENRSVDPELLLEF